MEKKITLNFLILYECRNYYIDKNIQISKRTKVITWKVKKLHYELKNKIYVYDGSFRDWKR